MNVCVVLISIRFYLGVYGEEGEGEEEGDEGEKIQMLLYTNHPAKYLCKLLTYLLS